MTDAISARPPAVFAMDPAALPLVFGASELHRLEQLLDIDVHRVIRSAHELSPEERARVELMVTGWGPPRLGTEELSILPSLRAVVHWGGGAGFVDLRHRGRVAVSSARRANAIPVAEYTVAMITLAAKDALWAARDYRARQALVDREAVLAHTGLFRRTIGVVGASTIGRLVILMLREREVETLVYDPFLDPSEARDLGVESIDDLESLARRSSILSVHAPSTPRTLRMVSRSVLAALPDGATLINTARGELVDQEALVDELTRGRLRAILDVTDPDDLEPEHPLFTLENVLLTPHLAGSTGSELRRLGLAAIAEIERYVSGQPFEHPFP